MNNRITFPKDRKSLRKFVDKFLFIIALIVFMIVIGVANAIFNLPDIKLFNRYNWNDLPLRLAILTVFLYETVSFIRALWDKDKISATRFGMYASLMAGLLALDYFIFSQL